MNSKQKYERDMMKAYLLCALVFVALSCIGLIWKDWEVLVCAAFGAVFGAINLFLLLRSSSLLNPGKDNSSGLFLGISGARSLLMLLAIGLPTLIIYFTRTGTGTVDNYRYLNIIVTGVPFIIISVLTAVVKLPEEPVVVSKTSAETPNSDIKKEDK